MDRAGKIYPRGARRKGMLEAGYVTPDGYGTVIRVRKQTAKYAKHYLVQHHAFGFAWMTRDQVLSW